ncbi:hypothetical protein [Mesorhizobium sp. M1E.F.Ca.ET.041.01.1.1]|uniref:hypothetical protein n=1 Tax=Mesorhizobium sp. M1E.F.Ca.ET.041.01.1.1 TaxID=2496759 RepID=UPI000FCC0614|nr:hypothetical protein [Mesorhizobium sp. M1E.F.Ca.ET.041.01.1.1]RUW18594.1 hypothetical protein EOA38_35660 [Mesorhizobium sp. M1E.F.Ca.ET.041.01.1.1]
MASLKAAPVATEVPWSDTLTDYDNEHFTLCMNIHVFTAQNASEEDIALKLLGIDPAKEPSRARKAVKSHLARVQWLVTTGHKGLCWD